MINKSECPQPETWFVNGGRCGWSIACNYCSENPAYKQYQRVGKYPENETMHCDIMAAHAAWRCATLLLDDILDPLNTTRALIVIRDFGKNPYTTALEGVLEDLHKTAEKLMFIRDCAYTEAILACNQET